MKKDLSALGLLWVALTSMIGSGWLFGSLYSAHFAGPAAVIAWPIAGVLLFFVALAFAEVTTMFPQKNSFVRLPLYTHGYLTGLILNGLTWISLVTIPVIETQGLLQYASNYLPGLMERTGTHYGTTPIGTLLAIVVLMTLVILNYFGVRIFARINAGFTYWKLIIPTLTIAILFSVSYHPNNFTQFAGFMPYGWQGVMKAISSGGIFFSLLGFRQVVIMMNKIENPGKYVPWILMSSLLFATLLYTGLQWCFIGSLHAVDLAQGWNSLSFVGDAGPFAALALIAGVAWLSTLLYVDAFISPYSTALVYTTTAANMLADMGEAGDVPKNLAVLNRFRVPWASLLLNFLFAAGMFLLLRGWQAMASFLVAAMMVSYAMAPICLICLRKQLPDYKRPFRVKGGEVVAFFGFYVCTAGVYWAGLQSIVKLLVLVSVSLFFYFLYHLFAKSLHQIRDITNAIWLIVYLLGLCAFSFFGNFGGRQLFPNYWDMIYLLVFSLVIFVFSVVSKKPGNFAPLSSRDERSKLAGSRHLG